jgi:hypothetical protein
MVQFLTGEQTEIFSSPVISRFALKFGLASTKQRFNSVQSYCSLGATLLITARILCYPIANTDDSQIPSWLDWL